MSRDEVMALRTSGASIRVIAAELNLPRSTVGDILRGVGSPSYYIVCERCGRSTVTKRPHARWCSGYCRRQASRDRCSS